MPPTTKEELQELINKVWEYCDDTLTRDAMSEESYEYLDKIRTMVTDYTHFD